MMGWIGKACGTTQAARLVRKKAEAHLLFAVHKSDNAIQFNFAA
ncbi:hypothetical protein [Roseobacter weihaiensis]|nr:hypothetical protein [Roseobacter sp. H9]